MYINLVELFSLMLHAKFQNHWPSGSGDFKEIFLFTAMVAILEKVTLTIYTNFRSPFLRLLHMKFGFAWPSSLKCFRGDL